jgi:hypothetical protein
MADTDIDAVRKQKKAEYNKPYSLKRKLLLQASTFFNNMLHVLLLCVLFLRVSVVLY